MHVIIWECSMRNSVVQRGSSDLYMPQSTADISLASRRNTNSFVVVCVYVQYMFTCQSCAAQSFFKLCPGSCFQHFINCKLIDCLKLS